MGKINIIFRYDDFILTESKFQEELLTFLESEKIPLIVGVIPFIEEENLKSNSTLHLNRLLKKGLITLGQHGYKHLNNSLNNSFKSEFYGIDYLTQNLMIKEGKIKLESVFNIQPEIFIPPFNTCDLITLKLLRKNRFKIISSSGFYNNAYISSLPSTITLDKLEATIYNKQNFNEDEFIVVLFHEYELTDMNYLKEIIQRLKLNNSVELFNVQNHIVSIENSLLVKSNNDSYFYFRNKKLKWKMKTSLKRFKYNFK